MCSKSQLGRSAFRSLQIIAVAKNGGYCHMSGWYQGFPTRWLPRQCPRVDFPNIRFRYQVFGDGAMGVCLANLTDWFSRKTPTVRVEASPRSGPLFIVYAQQPQKSYSPSFGPKQCSISAEHRTFQSAGHHRLQRARPVQIIIYRT